MHLQSRSASFRSQLSRMSSSTSQPNGRAAPGRGDGATETTSLINHDKDEKPPVWKRIINTTWAVLKSNYANLLLVFVPLGIVFGLLHKDPVTVFILNFFAIVPLAGLLSFATEELSAKMGQTIGGLMNATFGNAVELIVSIIALREGQIRIVQSSMLGSILSNILLVSRCRIRYRGSAHSLIICCRSSVAVSSRLVCAVRTPHSMRQ